MNPVRSIIAVLGGIGLVAIVSDVLEFVMVNASAGGTVGDMTAYFAVRNQPGLLAAKIVFTGLAAILGGYMAAKVAGAREKLHAGAAALVQTMALVWGFTVGEYAAFTPAWARIALVIVTGPAMLAGATIRARAAKHLVHSASEGSEVET